MTTHYVAGFMFSPDLSRVALIRKNRPKWQAGKLNGIGGHVEDNETHVTAMRREFREETGVDQRYWSPFASLANYKGQGAFFVAFFACRGDVDALRSETDETIEIFRVSELSPEYCVENLAWLIPLALDFLRDGRPSFAAVTYPGPDQANE